MYNGKNKYVYLLRLFILVNGVLLAIIKVDIVVVMMLQ